MRADGAAPVIRSLWSAARRRSVSGQHTGMAGKAIELATCDYKTFAETFVTAG